LLSTTLISSVEDFIHGWNVGDFEVKQQQTMSFFDIHLKENAPIPQIAQEKLEQGKKVVVLPESATIITLDKNLFSKRIETMLHLDGILSGVIIALCIYILVLIFRVMILFRKEKLFEELNVKRCNKIGITCIIIGLLETFVNISNTIMAAKTVELRFYNISYSSTIEWTTIIIGLIILVFTEILRISTNIKQEQDLTI